MASKPSFGWLLRYFRMRSIDQELGRKLSQERLGELIGTRLGIESGLKGATISEWERDKKRPRSDDRNTLIALVQTLCACQGIQTVEEANRLLEAGDYRTLNENEIAQTLGHFFPAVETESSVSILNKSPRVIEVSLVSSWSHRSDSGIAGVDVSADGNRILAGTLGKQVICFDQKGEVLWSAQVGNQAWRVALSADGRVAVVGTGSTRPWDMAGRGLYAFGDDGHLLWQKDLAASVWGLALAADGRTIAVGTDGHEALLFDGERNLLWRRRMTGLGWWAWVWAVALSADSQTVAVGSANKSLLILDRGGNLLGEHNAGADIHAVAVCANGQTVAAGSSDQQIYLVDRQGRLLWCEKLKDKVWTVALSADGQRLVVGAGEKEAHVRVFDRGGQALWKRYVEGGVSRVAISAWGQVVIVGTRAGDVHIFDGDGEPVYHHIASKIIRDVAISTDALVAAACSEDCNVYSFALPRFGASV